MATARHAEAIIQPSSAAAAAVASLSGAIASRQSDRALQLKYFSLFAVTAQNTAVVLLGRYLRIRTGDMFYSSTAVILAELLKLVSCLLVVFFECGSFKAFCSHLNRYIFSQPYDNLKITVPALVYVIQNNLLYLAMSNLDAATYQVTYQLKILTTALFSVVILRKRLSMAQWLSLFVLFAGVGIVQLQPDGSGSKHAVAQNSFLGLFAISLASLSSGFAGVYFEKLLKNTEQSIWIRNIQLGFLGVLFGLATAYVQDGEAIASKGFFFGYDELIWILIGLQSFGGLMVALVIKYADNIVKGFATSASIVLSCACSAILFDFVISYQFAAGAMFVTAAVYIYSRYPIAASAAPSTQLTSVSIGSATATDFKS